MSASPEQARRGQSQDVELGRAASRAGSAAPSRVDETLPWNVTAFDQGLLLASISLTVIQILLSQVLLRVVVIHLRTVEADLPSALKPLLVLGKLCCGSLRTASSLCERRQRRSSRQGSILEFGSPALLARNRSRQGSMTGHESLDRNMNLDLDGVGFEDRFENGDAFTFEETDLSTAAQNAKVQQERYVETDAGRYSVQVAW